MEDCEELKAQIGAMERAAESEKDETSKKLEAAKTQSATMQDNMQEKVSPRISIRTGLAAIVLDVHLHMFPPW